MDSIVVLLWWHRALGNLVDTVGSIVTYTHVRSRPSAKSPFSHSALCNIQYECSLRPEMGFLWGVLNKAGVTNVPTSLCIVTFMVIIVNRPPLGLC